MYGYNMLRKIDFISGCPVAGCENSKAKLDWSHEDCGYRETINENGIVECKNGHNLGEFFLLKYKCNGHSNGFQYGNFSAFAAALSVIAEFNTDFSAKLTEKLLQAYQAKRLPGQ